MATITNISDIPNLENQINKLKEQENQYSSKISSSPTATGGTGLPSGIDVSNQQALMRVQKQRTALEDSKLRAEWYPAKTQAQPGEETESPGMIGKTLDYINRPLMGIVGATKHVVGQGSKDTLWGDVAQNMMRDKNTFGDVLRTGGMNGALASGIGFGLDVMFDPTNWLTAGTGALIPRLAVGAKRGMEAGDLLKGIGVAAKSSVLEDATTLARYTPKLNKSKYFDALGEKSIKATNEWEHLSGLNAGKLVTERGLAGLGKYQSGVSSIIGAAIKEIPGSEKVLQHFVYDPAEWVRQARFLALVKKAVGVDVPTEMVDDLIKKTANKEDTTDAWKTIREYRIRQSEEVAAKTKGTPSFHEIAPDDINTLTREETGQISRELGVISEETASKAAGEVPGKVVKEHDDAITLMNDTTGIYNTIDPEANAARMAAYMNQANAVTGGKPFTLEDLHNIVKANNSHITGVDWYDKFIKNIGDYVIKTDKETGKAIIKGRDILDKYEQGLSIFKLAKVVLSPTSWVNAVAGNMLMHHMATGNLNPEYLKTLAKVADAKYGATKNGIYWLDDATKKIHQAILEDSAVFDATTGGHNFVGATARRGLHRKEADELLAKAGIDSTGMTIDQMKDQLKTMKQAQKVLTDKITKEIDMDALKMKEEVQGGTSAIRNKIANDKEINISDNTGLVSTEILGGSSATQKMFNAVAENKDKNPTTFNNILNYAMNVVPSGYESIDQVFKLTAIVYATKVGYTMNELRSIRNLVDIAPEALESRKFKGQMLYTLPESTAVELANVMFLNYAAMPSAVRVLRNVPLLGSPFVSFMYGMSIKTGQTLAYNPSAFNKVTFALSEFGGTKSPMEKQAIYDDSIDPKTGQPRNKYYSYLQQPGMYRLPNLPFLDQNPIYLNLANMIPYYSLNMFGPTNTNYGNSWREKIAGGLQKSTLMSDPAGNAIFENFLLPMILGDVQPQGRFGQPLYPINASAMEKVGYGTRNFAEAFVPNVMAFAGMFTPEEYAKYAPLYRWRAISEAAAGKNVLGITSKEPASSRANREKLKALGIPVQAPVNLPFSQ